MVTIEKFVQGITSIPHKEFTVENVWQFLDDTPIDVDSLSPFIKWSDKFYTRNLIFKNELFELMAVCWNVGQYSRVHNHADQKCWMTVPRGKLSIKNFKTLELDENQNRCFLEETETFELSGKAAGVDLDEPVHQVLNLSEFNEKAVSVHVYSKPIEKCLAYCLETNTYSEVPLFYTSINGKICDGINL